MRREYDETFFYKLFLYEYYEFTQYILKQGSKSHNLLDYLQITYDTAGDPSATSTMFHDWDAGPKLLQHTVGWSFHQEKWRNGPVAQHYLSFFLFSVC